MPTLYEDLKKAVEITVDQFLKQLHPQDFRNIETYFNLKAMDKFGKCNKCAEGLFGHIEINVKECLKSVENEIIIGNVKKAL